MQRGILSALLAVIGAVLLLSVGTVAALSSSQHYPPAFTLATLRASVSDHPSGWRGRVVRLRAVPTRQWCFDWVYPANGTCRLVAQAFLPAGTDDQGAPVLLGWEPPPPLLALLRSAPLIGVLAPGPQSVNWGRPGQFRVQLRAASCVAGAQDPCYEAAVVDAEAP
jgi:predicted ribosomally synthesized peptide with SipW-like signal peptide